MKPSETFVTELFHTSVQPFESEPTWAGKVPRWSQLDPASAAIAEAWHQWQDRGDLPHDFSPAVFMLAASEGSNRSDCGFARGGAFSPARFVSTLPSVNLSALLQVTGWVGPMYCIQNGPLSLASARTEAELFCRRGKGPVCIFGYETRGDPRVADCRVDVRCLIVGHLKS